MDSYVKVAKASEKEKAILEYQQSVYSFINDSGISKYNLEKSRFKDMMENACSVIKRGGMADDLKMGVHRFETLQSESFEDTTQTINAILSTVRRWYEIKSGATHKLSQSARTFGMGKGMTSLELA
ncbi:hypothetical protein ACA910_004584 [Epithemia clementina (nom. ined.)]